LLNNQLPKGKRLNLSQVFKRADLLLIVISHFVFINPN